MKNHIDSNFAIAILALVAACVGFAFWFLNLSSDEIFSQESRDIEKVTIDDFDKDEVVDEIDEDAVLSYSLERGGFTFEYPADWYAEGGTKNAVTFESSGVAVQSMQFNAEMRVFCQDTTKLFSRYENMTPLEIATEKKGLPTHAGAKILEEKQTNETNHVSVRTNIGFEQGEVREEIKYRHVNEDKIMCEFNYIIRHKDKLTDKTKEQFDKMNQSARFK